MALDHLELQAGIVIVCIPRQQRQPCQHAHRQCHPHAWITRHAPPLRQRQQRDEADADDTNEAIVAERTDRQAQRELHRRRCVDVVQQPRAGVQTDHCRQRHRHIRHCQQAQRRRQRHQQREAARLPSRHIAEPARGRAHHQQWQQRADGQERQAQGKHMMATDLHAQPCQPCGQPGQIRIRGRQVLAFLPVERFIDEQRQARSDHQLGRCDQRP